MQKPLRVCLIGAAGRMGRKIVDLAGDDADLDIVSQCDIGDAVEPALTDSDVVIDFSSADAVTEICAAVTELRKPLVIGTTGHSPEQRKFIDNAATLSAVMLASNFSVGVNALFWLTRKAAELLGNEFDTEIVEAHHHMKKDAPSGTAKTLAEGLKQARKLARPIKIQSIREGDIVGDHTVIFSTKGERLEFTHRASDRDIFARGALRAAKWIVGKPPGLYSMQDVLGL